VAATALGWAIAGTAVAGEEHQLVDALNHYRAQPQRCGQQASLALPPLAPEPRLQLPAQGSGGLNAELAGTGYPMVTARAISLSGPRDAQAALAAITSAYCQVVLDPQFVDIGVTQAGRDWRIVLARPLLTARLGSAEAEGRKLLDQLNQARAQPRQCGAQAFAATAPLEWDTALASAAQAHSRDMANHNYFDHADPSGALPGDRAELAGYAGREVAENIAAGQDAPARVLHGWLASPAHCANLMSPRLKAMGAAYATDPKSDAGIYWTALFGAP
jgi:uncharacterized protein YkwD